ncbi:MAG: transglycosylase domain-containing protein [Crocinitomicaceae bacterium]|nr:transglycosylase domain-containing protein [Crocinitomicaceae bacterium]
MSKKPSKSSDILSPRSKRRLTWVLWLGAMFPLTLIILLLVMQSEDDLPPVEMLDNPPELQASIIFADDGETELGKYWKINRSSVGYKAISPFVIDALVSTEDERFFDHSGVDMKAIGRAVVNFGGAGGASTISQQLAKLLFTLQQRDREAAARANGESVERSSGRIGHIRGRLNEKARENIIAVRLEERYTKEEIVTMYLNQFDFLYNAVGIANAAKVYFNKAPIDLLKEEAAMLVGMCKNPDLYNPYTFTVRNYRQRIAVKKGVNPNEVSEQEVNEARSKDSLRAVTRRNQVLYQWLKNSNESNEGLRVKITREEFDLLKMKPLITNYQVVDHKRGMAPYFRESVRSEVTNILAETNEDGSLKYKRADGVKWNIYSDGLKIYTTLNADMQQYAEDAVERHLKENLQPQFDKNNKGLKNFPFSNSLTKETVDQLMLSSMKRSNRYISMREQGFAQAAILATFEEKVPMKVFSWKGDIDTIMTPSDSIRYYKSYLQAGLISIEPETGFVKAWVGGTNIDHFAYDHVRLARRQVGSTIKPFIYAAGIAMNVVKPCTQIADIQHCVDLYGPDGLPDGKQWCPRNSDGQSGGGMISVRRGLQMSKNNITVAIMSKMGAKAGPQTVAKLLSSLDINLRDEDIVPAMCLGSMDLSLYELVGAQAAFVNKGIFNKPTTILRIEDRNGNVIYNAKPTMREAINEHVAYSVLKMMEAVVSGGTGSTLRSGASWGGIPYPTAGKTGTTQNNSDGWFIGLTPDLATGVWVGAEDRSVHFRSTAQGQGARTAAPIYGYYMQKVYKDPKIGISTTGFAKPANYDDSNFSCVGSDNILPTGGDEEAPPSGGAENISL